MMRIEDRLATLAERAVAARRRRVLARLRIAVEAIPGVAAEETAEGLALTGRGLGERAWGRRPDPRLRGLTAR